MTDPVREALAELIRLNEQQEPAAAPQELLNAWDAVCNALSHPPAAAEPTEADDLLDSIGDIALRLAEEPTYRHRAAEDLIEAKQLIAHRVAHLEALVESVKAQAREFRSRRRFVGWAMPEQIGDDVQKLGAMSIFVSADWLPGRCALYADAAPSPQPAMTPDPAAEPVGWVNGRTLYLLKEPGGWARVEGKRDGVFDTPLYLAPSPQPTQKIAEIGDRIDRKLADFGKSAACADPELLEEACITFTAVAQQAPTTVCGTGVAQQAAPAGQVLTDEELARIAYEGFDSYWTEDCAGKDSEAWAASAKAVLLAALTQGQQEKKE